MSESAVPPTPLAIRLFGPFEVRLNGGDPPSVGTPLPRLRSRKVQWLLALLALRAGRDVERAWLIGMLWPESPEAAALANLRSSLKDLRRALGAEAGRLRSTHHTLALDLSGAEVDVAAFDAAIAQGDPLALERAVSLYRAPLLEGCPEPWAFEERQSREQAYLGALERLAALALAAGDLEAAERHLRRAVAVDPLRESVRRALMQTLAAGGNSAAALLAYRDFRHLLHRELNAEPDPETNALFEQIRIEARSRTVRGARCAGRGEKALASRSALLTAVSAELSDGEREDAKVRRARTESETRMSGLPSRSSSPLRGCTPPSRLRDESFPVTAGHTTAALEPVGGAVPLDSPFYVLRSVDEEFRKAIARRDSIVLVKGAHQTGKTSLLARGLQQAREAGARVVLTDFQMLNLAHLATVEQFLLALAQSLAVELELEVWPQEIWKADAGANLNLDLYLRRQVFGTIDGSMVWGLDGVDRLFACDFGNEVFGLFRSWHDRRYLHPASGWSRLTLAMAYATEAHLFITDLNQSPFNVGTRLELEDFTLEQVADLNRRYRSPLRDEADVERFYRLVSGHPYLVRRGLHEMTSLGLDIGALETQADRDHGLFGDHLRRLLVLLVKDRELADVVRGVLQGRPCPTPESFYRLRAAGVLAGDSAQDVTLRCQLYQSYLTGHLL